MYTASTTNYPPKIYTLNLSSDQATLWDNPQEKQYENTLIDGRYYLPANFDPKKKYPLIVYYYGGTTPVARSFGGRWPFNLYTSNGYVVYVPQPSGCIGYGQEFSARHQNNWGKITADEIIASTKAFVKAHPLRRIYHRIPDNPNQSVCLCHITCRHFFDCRLLGRRLLGLWLQYQRFCLCIPLEQAGYLRRPESAFSS